MKRKFVVDFERLVSVVPHASRTLSALLCICRFGPGPHRVKLTIVLRNTNEEKTILLEMAPMDLMPHSVHLFLGARIAQNVGQYSLLASRWCDSFGAGNGSQL